MPKLARACALVVAIATSLAGGNAAAQIQSGVARKAAASSIALGIPAAAGSKKTTAASTSAASGSGVGFTSGQPALRYLPADLPGAKDPVRREAVKDGGKESGVSARGAAAAGTAEFAPAPGVLRANMAPVTFADAQRILKARVLPANLNQGVVAATASKTGKTSTSTSAMKISGDASPLGPASIAELARSLRNHPDLIYQYVRNNIEYYPTYGLQKGALGAVLDNQASAHDQASLMVELLRASGLETTYVRGIVKLSAAQLGEWWGVNTANVCGVLSLLGQAQIPVYEINATSAGSCPGLAAALTDLSIEHIWVKVKINGSWYVFEPNTTTGSRFRYTGQQLIGELGLYHYKARFYSPSLGRFLQTDPIGYRDDVNLYAYVGGNPINRIDPTGLASVGAWAYPTASGASTYPVPPQSNLQGTSLGNWIDNSPIHDPPLEGVYPEQYLVGGGLGVLRGAAQAAARGVGTAAAEGAGGLAANAANGVRLAEQLTMQSAKSPFTATGTLTQDAISGAKPIPNLEAGRLGNSAIPSGFGKYTTDTFRSPAGDFQVHFYKNPANGEVFYGLDYKAILNNMSGR